jgi:hypothetical protein
MSTTPKTIVHTRDAAELATLTSLFLNTAGIRPDKIIHGLGTDSQVDLRMAAMSGDHIITTGLPVDIASNIPQGFTQVRAWDITKPGGSRSMGVNPPTDFVVVKVANKGALAELLASDLYKKVTGELIGGDAYEESDDDDGPSPI